jgi:hypothetical protein
MLWAKFAWEVRDSHGTKHKKFIDAKYTSTMITSPSFCCVDKKNNTALQLAPHQQLLQIVFDFSKCRL